jgi:hypothetical protein
MLFTASSSANAARLREIADALEVDDVRTRAIFKSRLILTEPGFPF